MNEKLKALIEACGQVAEIAKIQFDAFVGAGFTEMQALSLTGDFMAALIMNESNGGDAYE